MSPVRIIVASDIHLTPATAAGREAASVFGQAWSALSPALAEADALLLLGDLTDDGDASAYARIAEAVQPLPGVVLAVPGNHDEPAGLEAALAASGGDRVAERVHRAATAAGCHLLALDTSEPGRASGVLSGACLAWLDEKLARAGGAPVVIGMHHSALRTGLDELDRMGLVGGREGFLEIVEAYAGSVVAVAGHFHVARTCYRAGVQHVLNPTLSARPGQWRLWSSSTEIVSRARGATALSLDAEGAWHVEFLGGW
jgi:3',5'-cyclic AMP phosphodiesterase CpdA